MPIATTIEDDEEIKVAEGEVEVFKGLNFTQAAEPKTARNPGGSIRFGSIPTTNENSVSVCNTI